MLDIDRFDRRRESLYVFHGRRARRGCGRGFGRRGGCGCGCGCFGFPTACESSDRHETYEDAELRFHAHVLRLGQAGNATLKQLCEGMLSVYRNVAAYP